MVSFEDPVDFATTCQLTLIRVSVDYICQLFIVMLLQQTFY